MNHNDHYFHPNYALCLTKGRNKGNWRDQRARQLAMRRRRRLLVASQCFCRISGTQRTLSTA